MLDVAKILEANLVAAPASPAEISTGSLPYTGGAVLRLIGVGLVALALGVGLVWTSGRRRRWRSMGH